MLFGYALLDLGIMITNFCILPCGARTKAYKRVSWTLSIFACLFSGLSRQPSCESMMSTVSQRSSKSSSSKSSKTDKNSLNGQPNPFGKNKRSWVRAICGHIEDYFVVLTY